MYFLLWERMIWSEKICYLHTKYFNAFYWKSFYNLFLNQYFSCHVISAIFYHEILISYLYSLFGIITEISSLITEMLIMITEKYNFITERVTIILNKDSLKKSWFIYIILFKFPIYQIYVALWMFPNYIFLHQLTNNIYKID